MYNYVIWDHDYMYNYESSKLVLKGSMKEKNPSLILLEPTYCFHSLWNLLINSIPPKTQNLIFLLLLAYFYILRSVIILIDYFSFFSRPLRNQFPAVNQANKSSSYMIQCIFVSDQLKLIAQSAGAVEYTDYTSANGLVSSTSVLIMTLNNLMVRYQWCWSFGECGVRLHYHCSIFHSGPEW